MVKKPLSKAKTKAKAARAVRPPGIKPRKLDYTSGFYKDWTRYDKAGRHDMSIIQTVSALLVARQVIPAQYLDHALTGEWSDNREMHLGGDFLLIYKIYEEKNLVMLVALGTHAELFN
ncbi:MULTISPECIES: type II toxin-antitoxin system YafQ family toxin [Serratia]|uniref:type II toxin-antitoxin system YafQ family toxin n=1 Tax=Serratia TaxID=613 RepID=UPI0020C630B7|nr:MULTISPECIES: type II toxin-antitoxin system YafQ family toxin [Serratia]